MKISYNWLKEYVAHSLSPDALGDALTMCGLELEAAETIGSALDGVVVGQVLEVIPHPRADRLTLCRVDLGEGDPVQIVCGAPNVAAGQKAPVATVGTTLMLPGREQPGEKGAVTLQKAKIRGEVSHGMICAEDELGLSDDHTGIMVLRDDAPVGQPFAAYLHQQGIATQDTALDLVITPNRPDATSHFGVARDVAALTDAPLQRPDVPLPEPGGEAAEQVSVEIECPEACHRYVALLVRNITIRASPAWLMQRLRTIGLRPINNVVDVTNYVMYECGQPLHAFDFDQIDGARIIVRQSRGQERFTTLDSKEHTLPDGTVLICDAARPVAIGGIMGGENSEVSAATTNVLIESAYFDPSVTRKAAKTLGLSTDASYRFERGVDPEGQVWAAARAAHLIAVLGDGVLVPGMVDAHPVHTAPRTIPLRLARIEKILGIDVRPAEAERILTTLGFAVEAVDTSESATLARGAQRFGAAGSQEKRQPSLEALGLVKKDKGAVVFACTVPSYRPDVEREIDVIEEVARIYGYDNIPEPVHTPLTSFIPRPRPVDLLRDVAQTLLKGRGYRELYTNSLLPRGTATLFGQGAASEPDKQIVETLNPISQEMGALRPSLLPGTLQAMGFNQNHGQDVLRFYEFGHVFQRSDRDDVPIPGYAEHASFILALSGPDAPPGWDREPRPVDFFDLKGDVEALLDAFRLPDVVMTPSYDATPIRAYHLTVTSGDTYLGVVACLADTLMEAFNLKAPAYFAELDWTALVNRAAPFLERTYTPVSRYPVVDRDIAVVVHRDQAVGPMLETIRKAGGSLLRAAGVFDRYEGESLGADRMSVAFSLRFGTDRTLTDAEVDQHVDTIVGHLAEAYQAVLRQ